MADSRQPTANNTFAGRGENTAPCYSLSLRLLNDDLPGCPEALRGVAHEVDSWRKLPDVIEAGSEHRLPPARDIEQDASDLGSETRGSTDREVAAHDSRAEPHPA